MIWNNIVTAPNRWMAWYLKRQGWVCFYLEPRNRDCGMICYLQLYQEAEARDARAHHGPV